jgi:hypothetical protein
LTNTKQRELSNSNQGSDSDPDPDMDSGMANSKLVTTIFNKYKNNVKVNKQIKPTGQKVFRDEQYNTQTQRVNKRNLTVPKFNQDEYTTEEESFVPNTRIIKNDINQVKKREDGTGRTTKKIRFKRPLSITLPDKKLRTPRVINSISHN